MPNHAEIPRRRAVGIVRLGQSYVEAAEALEQLDGGTSEPRYFLYGHGVELCLKALLVVDGASEHELRKVGHDLGQATRLLRERGLMPELGLTNSDWKLVEWLNRYYQEKEFEYLIVGYKELPHPADLKPMTERLLKGAWSCIGRRLRAGSAVSGGTADAGPA
jgi:HEPN domain-containing protein